VGGVGVIWNLHSVTQTKGGEPRICHIYICDNHPSVVPGAHERTVGTPERRGRIRFPEGADQIIKNTAIQHIVPSVQHISKQGGEYSGCELSWEWTGNHLWRDMNTKFSQSFFRSLILCSLFRVPSPTTNAIPIHHGSNDPNRRRLGPLSSAISVHPLKLLRLPLQTLVEQSQMPHAGRGILCGVR